MTELLKTAIDVAKGAGQILQEGFGTNFKISSKTGKNNLVTEYDHKAEKYIIDTISSKYPNHNFLAEESGASGEIQDDEIRWVIDPLDGTVNYAHNIPIFSVSIAAEQKGELLCGVVYNPIINELFHAEKGGGAYLNNHKLRVSQNDDFFTSLLVTGFPYNVNQNPCNCIDMFVSVIQSGIPVRRLGSAALDLAYVAAGRFDGFWEIQLYPWDVAAGTLLVQEAGGKVSQYDGKNFNISDNSIIATNGGIHDTVIQQIKKCRLSNSNAC